MIWVSGKQDLLGADIIALKKHRKILFIQCTLHTSVQKRLDEFLKYPWPLEHVLPQVWQKRKNGVNIKVFDGYELRDAAKIIRRKFYLEEKYSDLL